MKIGQEVLIKARVVDFDGNLHGASVKVEVSGFIDHSTVIRPLEDKTIKFWVHRIDKAEVILEK
ncbi:hypothetical protein KJ969_00540 [Patescibacteria group bacterium]|nr:hypothetical protein [Patescibacteria group bacterium]MBU1922395.1 hypothetical protein [Patescibacteria group bacterium]